MQTPIFGLAGLFLIELLLLFLFARFLTSALARFFYTLTGSQVATVNILAFLFLPGTIIHEVSHFLVAGMMLVPVGRMEIFPQIEGEEVRLGSAEIAQTDMLRRSIIGVAPVVIGLGLILSILWLVGGKLSGNAPFWQVIAVLYVIFEIGNTMFSSKKDMEGALAFFLAVFLILAGFFIALSLTGHPVWEFVSNWLNSVYLREFLKKADLFLLVPLGVDVVFLGLMQMLRSKAG